MDLASASPCLHSSISTPYAQHLKREILARIAALAAEACLQAQSLPPPERLAVLDAWVAALESALQGVRYDS